jgi:S1-C subfamily serine protease
MDPALQTLNEDLATVIARGQQSLVQVHNGRTGAGAGTILHEEGLIVTNAHVVQRHSPTITLWDGRTLPGRLLGLDEQRDLAAVAITGDDLMAIALAGRNEPRPGQLVVALGHPWGVRGAASAGMVIAVGPPLEGSPYRGDLIQVGLNLRPGHSGGPMLNSRGELVGINTMISGPKVGMAIPVNVVKHFLRERLGRRGRRDRPRARAPWVSVRHAGR